MINMAIDDLARDIAIGEIVIMMHDLDTDFLIALSAALRRRLEAAKPMNTPLIVRLDPVTSK